MNKIKYRLTLLALSICMGIIACKKEKNTGEEIGLDASFDKAGMLRNLGENIILPSYSGFKTAVDSLYQAANLFINNPSSTTLQRVQEQFSNAYVNYQHISTFEFGPADAELLRANFNTFPCDTLQINTKIAAGDFNFSAVSELDAKGLPAIDFLLFCGNTDEVLNKFTIAKDAKNTQTYLSALVTELKHKTDVVNQGWNGTNGNYLSSFKNNTGSNVGSPIGMLVNQLNLDYELLKNAKIGIPLGKKSMGTPLPAKAEAVYCEKSLLLAMEHLKTLENIYLGRNADNVDGLGFDDYLAHLKAKHPSGDLNEVIKNKFTSAKLKLAAIPGTLSKSILLHPAVVDAAYTELQQLVILLKVDMSSALGVMITYEDNDGD